jgi:UDP-N-acetylmuramoylalanine-D-glutamate ligase
VAGITNISPDHLDRYASFEEYAATKQRIFMNQNHEDFAVIRANDPVVIPPGSLDALYRPRQGKFSSEGAKAAVEHGLHATGDFAHDGKPDIPTTLTFGHAGHDARVDDTQLIVLHRHIEITDLPFAEPHNLVNATMACLLAYSVLAWKGAQDPDSNAAALLMKAEEEFLDHQAAMRTVYDARRPTDDTMRVLPPQIVEGLKQFKGLAHRMEPVGERNGIRIVNNSMCTNPDAVVKSAESIQAKTHLLIGGVNKGLDFKPLADYLANHNNKAYLFGSDAGELDKMLGGGYPMFATLADAFQAAVHEAGPGEVVMLAPGCASTDQFRDFRDRGEKFRTIAKEWLDS